jgi:mRNA interferase MazF
MGVVVRRFDVFLIALDPTIGREIRKTRPCLVVSPDEMNMYLATVLVAPMTTGGHLYPTRVPCRFRGKEGRIALDQIRAVDRSRLVRRLGRIGPSAKEAVLSTLGELFAR